MRCSRRSRPTRPSAARCRGRRGSTSASSARFPAPQRCATPVASSPGRCSCPVLQVCSGDVFSGFSMNRNTDPEVVTPVLLETCATGAVKFSGCSFAVHLFGDLRPDTSSVGNDLVLTLVVITALGFDFTNGFHDTGNAMATSIATGALPPRIAVALSGALNLVGAFLSLSVAATIASGLVDTGAVTLTVVLAGLCGGILWNLLTWLLGIPSSSSHALIGGVIGST